MNRYTIYCTKEQTRKALELGAPIKANKDYSNGNLSETLCVYGDIINKDKWGIGECTILHIPTAEQMIGFLRSKGIKFHFNDVTNFWRVICHLEIVSCGWNENKELAAIDAALEYLNNNKK